MSTTVLHSRAAPSLCICLPKPSRGSLTNMGKNSGNVMNVFVVPFSLLSTRLKSKLLVLLRLCLWLNEKTLLFFVKNVISTSKIISRLYTLKREINLSRLSTVIGQLLPLLVLNSKVANRENKFEAVSNPVWVLI